MMTEEREYSLRMFKLEVGASTSKVASVDLDPQLIGKIISDNALNSEEVESFICKAWEWHYGKVQITHLEDNNNNNMYLFSFQDSASAERVIQDGPWVVMGHFLYLQRCRGSHKSLEEVHFTHVPIWVQVHGLMSSQTTEGNARYIGNYIGEFVKTDERILDYSLNWGFLRINVLLDCSAVIKTDMWVNIRGQVKYQINFKYERMADFCFNCGRLGHILSECEEEALPLPHPRFGAWLRASTEVSSFETEQVVDISETGNNDSWKEIDKPLLGKDKKCKPRKLNFEPIHPCDLIGVVLRLVVIVLVLKLFWIFMPFHVEMPPPYIPPAEPPVPDGD